MISLRLSKELQQQLEQLSEQRSSTKTHVAREALAYYFAERENIQRIATIDRVFYIYRNKKKTMLENVLTA